MASAATASAPAIVANGASKLFLDGAVVAFHQLSLEVRRNEILCVVVRAARPKIDPHFVTGRTFSAAADCSVDAKIAAAEGVRFARYTGKLLLTLNRGRDGHC
jgi:hypothetical protein